MKTRLFSVCILVVGLALALSWAVSAQQQQEPASGSAPSGDGLGVRATSAVTVGQPGLSFRYVRTFGVTEQPYSADAQHVNTMGVNLATASADYQGAYGQLELIITDMGNLSGPMRMGMTGWAVAKIDSETDTGYEKTLTYQGYKAMEQYNRQDREGTLRVFAADRFVVEVSGTGVTMETIKQAMGQVDLKKLAGTID